MPHTEVPAPSLHQEGQPPERLILKVLTFGMWEGIFGLARYQFRCLNGPAALPEWEGKGSGQEPCCPPGAK